MSHITYVTNTKARLKVRHNGELIGVAETDIAGASNYPNSLHVDPVAVICGKEVPGNAALDIELQCQAWFYFAADDYAFWGTVRSHMGFDKTL